MDRAVSDVLGYVLIFALITGSVALVYATGYGSLTNVRDAERFNNAERAFDVLDSNVEDVVYDHAPSRATEIKLSDSTIGYGDPTTFNVTFGYGESIETEVVPVRFGIGDEKELVYSNGAIIRRDGQNSVMRDEPNFIFGERTVLPIIDSRAQSRAISGSGRVLVRTEMSKQDVYNYTTNSTYNITLNVTSQQTDAWNRYLEAETGNDCTVTGNTVSCDYNSTDAVFIKITKLDVFII